MAESKKDEKKEVTDREDEELDDLLNSMYLHILSSSQLQFKILNKSFQCVFNKNMFGIFLHCSSTTEGDIHLVLFSFIIGALSDFDNCPAAESTIGNGKEVGAAENNWTEDFFKDVLKGESPFQSEGMYSLLLFKYTSRKLINIRQHAAICIFL